jgi:hypothetical protein
VRPLALSGNVGQRFELLVYPISTTAEPIFGRYRVHPIMLTSGAKYPYGGMTFGRLITEACLAEFDRLFNENSDLRHDVEFEKLLVAAKQRDAEAAAPATLGHDLPASDVTDLSEHEARFAPDYSPLSNYDLT